MIHEPLSPPPSKTALRPVPVMLDIELRPDLAMALAQFCKRACWSDFRACAVNDDEAYEMRDAIAAVREALQRHGYAPR